MKKLYSTTSRQFGMTNIRLQMSYDACNSENSDVYVKLPYQPDQSYSAEIKDLGVQQ